MILFVAPHMVRIAGLVLLIAGFVPVVTTFAIPEKHVQIVQEIVVPVPVPTILMNPPVLRQTATGIVMAMSVIIILVSTMVLIHPVVIMQVAIGIVITIDALVRLVPAIMISTVANLQVVLGTATLVINLT